MPELMEKLSDLELEISDLKEKLEELLFLEKLRKGELNKDSYEKEVRASFEEGSISKGTYEHLILIGKKRGIINKKKLDYEAAREFVEAFNILSRAKKAFGLESEYLELEEKPSVIDSIKKALTKVDEKPRPIRGGTSITAKLKSLFIESEKPKKITGEAVEAEVEGVAEKKAAFIGQLQEKLGKIANIFIAKPPVAIEEESVRFYVPAFATDTGLTEKRTKEELAQKRMFDNIKKESIMTLKEKLFAEGEKAEPLVKASGLTTLIPGYAYAKIVKEKNGRKVYYVIEPDLTKDELKKIELIKAELIEVLTIEELTREKMFAKVEEIIRKRGYTFTRQGRHKLMYYLSRDLLGLERLEPLMHDNMIEDIECDGVGIPVYVIHKKEGHMPTNVVFETSEALEDFIIKMAQLAKTYVSYASPLLDAVLPDGSRVNAVLTSSVSTRGPSFTIRLFPEKPLSPTALIDNDTADARIMAYFWTILEFKKSILITGPTASGKTTLLNAIAMFIPQSQRVVSIEDTRELNLKHENWLPQVARPGFGPPDATGKRFGEIDLMTLIKESFRQRPDYLIVGEVRGKETFILFQGMASGHCCLATMHARSVIDVVSRLITPPINLYPSLLESVDVIVNLGFVGEEGMKRRIRTIAEVKRYNMKEQRLEYVDILEKGAPTMQRGELKIEGLEEFFPLTNRSVILRKISEENSIPLIELEKRIEKRTAFLKKLVKEKVFDFKDFTDRLEAYRNAEKDIIKSAVQASR